jgi:hypothetical protein
MLPWHVPHDCGAKDVIHSSKTTARMRRCKMKSFADWYLDNPDAHTVPFRIRR